MAATIHKPERVDVQAGAVRFGALSWGEADAPLALLLHGYPDTAWTWRHLGPHLAGQGWRAVAPFMRGYAPTDLAPDDSYFVADFAGDVLALHEALGGDDRAALVGHDWGAVTVWAVTGRDPSRFARHVAISIPPPLALLQPWRSVRTLPLAARQLAHSWYFVFNQIPGTERGLDRLAARLWRMWAPGYDAHEDLQHFRAAVTGPQRRRAAQRYYRDNLKRGLVRTFALSAGAPALYLHGEDDGCVEAEVAAPYAAARLPHPSRVERLDGVGHFPQLEDPERVNALIGAWLGAPGQAP